MKSLKVQMTWALCILTSITMCQAENNTVGARCPHPYQQVYSEKAGKCLSLVGGPCEPVKITDTKVAIQHHKINSEISLKELEAQSWTDGCISGALCVKDGLFGYCTCSPTLVSTSDRKCSLRFGTLCNESEIECDQLLGCIQGKCKCRNDLHEFEHGQCVGKVGAFCKIRPNHRNYLFDGKVCKKSMDDSDEENDKCIQRAFCDIPSGDKFGNGVCRCNWIFGPETVDRICIADAGLALISWILFLLVLIISLLLCCTALCRRHSQKYK